jgi:hypothetical protein
VSIPNRIYRIGKAYLNRVRDRIEELDAEAERELESEADRPLPNTPSPRPAPARDDTSVEAMMRRAEDRIRAARGEAGAREELGADREPSRGAAPATDANATHYRVLGVPVGSDWPTVQAAYEKLARRCDVRRFPDGSEEQNDARRILERVNVAYEALRKQLDPLDSRFDKLEL